MKIEDIDKKIGMPDVDEEWAKFEREVIDEETKPQKRVFIRWTIGIAASIALALGIFLWGDDEEKQIDSSRKVAQVTKVKTQEKIMSPMVMLSKKTRPATIRMRLLLKSTVRIFQQMTFWPRRHLQQTTWWRSKHLQ